jgi:hypothetical protein
MVLIVVFWVVMLCGLIDGYHALEDLEVEAACFSKVVVTMNETAQCQNPEEHNQRLHHHLYLKSQNVIMMSGVYQSME